MGGQALAYEERGRGQPLVLVHGSASDYRTWQPQHGPLASHFRTIRYSRRYHWPNEPIPEDADYAMDEHVCDLEALLHGLDASPAHLVGHSYGAFVCVLLALRAPHLVRTLVLAEPPAITLFLSNPPRPGEIAGLAVTRPRTAAAILRFLAMGVVPATMAVKRGDREGAIRAFGRATLGRRSFAALSDARRAQVRANTIDAELLGSGFPPVDPDRIRRLRRPTLLVQGARSPAFFARIVDRLFELLPDADRCVIPEASHIMHEDEPPAYLRALLDFLGRHRAEV